MLNLIKDWWTRQDTMWRLRSIDDRLLADMGLARDRPLGRDACGTAALPGPSPAVAALCLSMTLRS